MSSGRLLLLAALLVSVAASLAWLDGQLAAEVSVSVEATPGSDGGKATTTFKVKIDGLEDGVRWKDFHIWPPDAPQYPPPTLPKIRNQTVDVNCGGCDTDHEWKLTSTKSESGKASSGVHMEPKSGNGFGNGTFTFTIKWGCDAIPEEDLKDARVVLTKNGGTTYGEGDIIRTITVPKLPVLGLACVDQDLEPPIVCALGADTPLVVQVETPCPAYVGTEFAIYSSLTMNEECLDPLGIGINNDTDPVPPGWGLLFVNFEGTIGPDGRAQLPVSITTPPDPSLVGQKFYVVLALLDAEGEVTFSTDPTEVSFQ